MYGRSTRESPQSESIMAQAKDPPGHTAMAVQFRQSTAQPWVTEVLGHPQLASANTYGRGVLAVSNKVSEVNIGNMPVVIVVAQQAGSSFSRYTPRIMSLNIPVPSQMRGG